jgi:curved DNA-binding protein CbpA
MSDGKTTADNGDRSALTDLNLYERLGVPKDAPIDVIRRAYRKQALAVHPDRNSRPSAQRDFQLLAAAMEVLGDPKRRASYDAGTAEDDEDDTDGPAAMDAARSLYKRVTEADIIAFEERYVGSAEERSDVRAAMNRYPANMQSVIDSVPFARMADADRFRRIMASTDDDDDDDDDRKRSQLIPIATSTTIVPEGMLSMREREKRRHMAMVASMELRFGGRRNQTVEEPPEDEFLAIQRRLDENKANRRSSRGAAGPADRTTRRRRTVDPPPPLSSKRPKA